MNFVTPVCQVTLTLQIPTAGLHEMTGEVARELKISGLRHGIVTVFCRHTSASLVIMENADPSARDDLQAWLERTLPENDPRCTHTLAGPDDMPSRIKIALTRPDVNIPFSAGQLLLGT